MTFPSLTNSELNERNGFSYLHVTKITARIDSVILVKKKDPTAPTFIYL